LGHRAGRKIKSNCLITDYSDYPDNPDRSVWRWGSSGPLCATVKKSILLFQGNLDPAHTSWDGSNLFGCWADLGARGGGCCRASIKEHFVTGEGAEVAEDSATVRR
jgi:hypothetical protein